MRLIQSVSVIRRSFLLLAQEALSQPPYRCHVLHEYAWYFSTLPQCACLAQSWGRNLGRARGVLSPGARGHC